MLILAIRTKGVTDTLSRVENSMWSKAIGPLLNEMHVNLVLGSFLVSISGATLMFENDVSTRWTGYSWLRFWPSFVTGFYVAFAAVAIRRILLAGHLEQQDGDLAYSIAISLPFLAVLQTYKLYLLIREGSRALASYQVGASNAIIAILPQTLVIVAYHFIALAAAPRAPQSTAEESGRRSKATGAKNPAAHKSLLEANVKGLKGERNEQKRT